MIHCFLSLLLYTLQKKLNEISKNKSELDLWLDLCDKLQWTGWTRKSMWMFWIDINSSNGMSTLTVLIVIETDICLNWAYISSIYSEILRKTQFSWLILFLVISELISTTHTIQKWFYGTMQLQLKVQNNE